MHFAPFFRGLRSWGSTLAILTGLVASPLRLFAVDAAEARVALLHQQVSQLQQAGKYAEAIPLAEKLVQLCEEAVGNEDPATAFARSNLAESYRWTGALSKAERLYLQAIATLEKTIGKEHPYMAAVLNGLAMVYHAQGDDAKAEPLFQQSLDIVEKAYPEGHAYVATALANSADVKTSKGDYAAAELLYQRALVMDERFFGPEDLTTLRDLKSLATLYRTTREYGKAKLLYQRVLRIAEKNPHDDPTAMALYLNDLAGVYRSLGEYGPAEPLYQRALRIVEKALGPNHPHTAVFLNNLAGLYHSAGEYSKAEPLHQRALRIDEKALGPDDPAIATDLRALAELYRLTGSYAKAEPLFQRALRIQEKALAPDDVEIAETLNNMAALYHAMGDDAKAEPLFQRALTMTENKLGPDHPNTGSILCNLANMYRFNGDYSKAEPLFQRARQIYEQALGASHPDTAKVLGNLAALYYSTHDYLKAKDLLEEVVKVYEKVYGFQHPETAAAFNNLAQVFISAEAYTEAEPVCQRVLEINEKTLGRDHPTTALSLSNLASLYRSMGSYQKAEPLFRRALKIEDKMVGPNHPETAMILNNLAFLMIDLGRMKDSLPLAARALRAEEHYLSNILSFTSEQQRLAFQETTHPYTLPATLGQTRELAQTVLRQKGIVLDSLLEDRLVAEASNDPKQRESIEQIRADKQRLMQLTLEVPKDLSEAAQKTRATEKGRLSVEVEQLEANLARRVSGLGKARRALSVTIAQVQSVLPKQATLAELIRYSHYVGKDTFEPRYGAVLIFPNGEPKWIGLGSAKELEKKIALYQKSARGETDATTLRTVLKALYEQVWKPIERAFPPGTDMVIVSPDAKLSFVSFATLLSADDRFVSEKYSLSYVASGRDLLRETKSVTNQKSLRLFANPNFAANADTVTRPKDETYGRGLRSTEMRDLQSISLRDLPGTAREAEELESRARNSGWQCQASLGLAANEAELRAIDSPRVLHLATHGFFLPETKIEPAPNNASRQGIEMVQERLANPMHRSGLALAGAQNTLQGWGRGEVPPTDNDGIVTAEEVGGLRLNETWLVALSACDTGAGEARVGEGVMGLRRGFVQAGTRNLLLTLWPISDELTVNIMLDFYVAAFKTGKAPQALADTQRDWLVRLRQERGLLLAVQLAGPFIVSFQGNPNAN